MNVVFRSDSSVYIGTGHVMRCLALATAMKEHGYSVSFACMPQKNDLIGLIRARGFEVICLSRPLVEVVPEHDEDYQAWLQKSQEEDAQDFIRQVREVDIVVTDHYAIDYVWQRKVKDILDCKIIAIDDLVRTHYADLLIDQSLGRNVSEYIGIDMVLAGSDYAILSSEFPAAREISFDKCRPSHPLKVLISMGGVDAKNVTLHILQSLIGKLEASFTVLLSPRAPNYHSVVEWCKEHSQVEHFDFINDMSALLLKHDIAIGAPGTSSWERACLGLPSVIIPIAGNQINISNQLASRNAVIVVEKEKVQSSLVPACKNLVENWRKFYKSSIRICDGRGAIRSILKVNEMTGISAKPKIKLVFATKNDTNIIFEWQCDARTRMYSLNRDAPSWIEHQAWMSKKLESYTDFFFIIKSEILASRVGVLRLDRQSKGNYLLSILIAPSFYGQGLALEALTYVSKVFLDLNLHAVVLESNTASQKLFEKVGFSRVSSEKFIRKSIGV